MAYFEEPIIPTRMNHATAGSALNMTLCIPGAARGRSVIRSVTPMAVSCTKKHDHAADDDAYDKSHDKSTLGTSRNRDRRYGEPPRRARRGRVMGQRAPQSRRPLSSP
jgi:hypothetical protein